jgi:hypothetical protein
MSQLRQQLTGFNESVRLWGEARAQTIALQRLLTLARKDGLSALKIVRLTQELAAARSAEARLLAEASKALNSQKRSA